MTSPPALVVEGTDELQTKRHDSTSSRPQALRRSTDPTLPTSASLQPTPSPTYQSYTLPYRSRNRSPYSRAVGHNRSRSSGGSHLAALPMTRAHSLPTTASISISYSPLRSASPLRQSIPAPLEEEEDEHSGDGVTGEEEGGAQIHTLSNGAVNVTPSHIESYVTLPPAEPVMDYIPEDEELDFGARATAADLVPPVSAASYGSAQTPGISLHSSHSSPALSLYNHNSYSHNTFPRRHHFPRRPHSPLHSTTLPFTNNPVTTPTRSRSQPQSPSSSPKLAPARLVNEAYPASLSHQSSFSTTATSSSITSSPTSVRSRSPSISSLETIEDSPDAEAQEEMEMRRRLDRVAERAEKWRRGAGAGGAGGEAMVRKGSLELPRSNRWEGGAGGGWGSGRRDLSARKRWSVCGAERWGDEKMETIWED